jgi:hypothetical protein
MSDGLVFEVRTDDRVYYIASDDIQDMIGWVVALRAVRAFAGSLGGQQATESLLKNYMRKQGKGNKGLGKRWKERWVDLRKNGNVLYYEKHDSTHPKGNFKLAAARPSTNAEPKFGIDFVAQDARVVWFVAVRAVPGWLSAISVFLCKSVLYGAFVWARRALNSRKRRFPAWAEDRAGVRRLGEGPRAVVAGPCPRPEQGLLGPAAFVVLGFLVCS